MPLLLAAIGDAFGRPFEFNTPEFIKENNELSSYKHRIGEEQNGIGIYTDDVQMQIAIAEQMLSGLPGTQVRFASHFVTAYKRDPRKGYSKRITSALEESKSNLPFELILKAKQAGANSNGSVMRAVPLGLLADPKEIMYRSIVQTSVTHGHIEAVNAATAVSLTAHYFYYIYHTNKSKFVYEKLHEYREWMNKQMGSVFDDIYNSYDLDKMESLQCDAKTTASLSIKLAWGYDRNLTKNSKTIPMNTAKSILKKAIDIGGDVDSSSSIALGLYSLRTDAIMDLPAALYDNLENGPYGRDYLTKLDAELIAKFPRNVKEETPEEIKLTDLIS